MDERSADQAVGALRRQLTDPRRTTTHRGEPAVKLDPRLVIDLLEAYVALRQQR